MAQAMIDEKIKFLESNSNSIHIEEKLSDTKSYELYKSKSYKDYVLSFNSGN